MYINFEILFLNGQTTIEFYSSTLSIDLTSKVQVLKLKKNTDIWPAKYMYFFLILILEHERVGIFLLNKGCKFHYVLRK
jgi:hypothetical protein